MEATEKKFTIDLSLMQYELLSEMFADASFYRAADQKTKKDYFHLMIEISNQKRIFIKEQKPQPINFQI